MGCVPASGSCKFKYSSPIPESPLQLNMGVRLWPNHENRRHLCVLI